MLKKTITYVDFTGTERTQDFYFNLSKAEVIEYEVRNNFNGGVESLLKTIIASNDGNQIMNIFKDIIARSYGIKGADGFSFEKSEAISQRFLGSEAYSELFLELMNNPDIAAEFIRGILPADYNPTARSQQGQRPPTQDHQQRQPVTRHVPSMPSVQQPYPEQDRPYVAEPQRPTVDVPLPQYQEPYQETRPAHEQGVQQLPQATQQFRERVEYQDPQQNY